MGLLKKILRKRKDLKLIVSSATVDAEYVRDFFTETKSTKITENDGATILSVQGRSYSVDVHYLLDPCPNYVQCCVESIMKVGILNTAYLFKMVISTFFKRHRIMTFLQYY
jgi:ATP-dependent RNA helicase DDX35